MALRRLRSPNGSGLVRRGRQTLQFQIGLRDHASRIGHSRHRGADSILRPRQNAVGARGNRAQFAYFGADEKPGAIAEGYRRVFGRYDDRRHITERRFFGIDEKLVNLPQQFAIRRTKYDEHGRILEDAYFDASEQPAVVSAGYHRVAVSYDEFENELVKAWFGADGQLSEPSAEVSA